MDTKQKDFIERRRAAHQAGTVDIDKDPLVRAAKEARSHAAEVMGRWKDLRNAGTPKEWPARPARRSVRSQAE